MIHLHRSIAFVVVCFLCAPFSASSNSVQVAEYMLCRVFYEITAQYPFRMKDARQVDVDMEVVFKIPFAET